MTPMRRLSLCVLLLAACDPRAPGAALEAGAPAATLTAAPSQSPPKGPTWLLADVRPGASSSYPDTMVALGSRLVFVADDGVHRARLWTSDGTPAGTALVEPPIEKEGWLVIDSHAIAQTTLFFTFIDHGAFGQELWRTDGTGAGTSRVKDINPGKAGSYPAELTTVGSRVFFTADDGTHGRELWVSDGTDAGTRLVKDIAPNDPPPFPEPGSGITTNAPPDHPVHGVIAAVGERRGYAAKPVALRAAGDRLFFVMENPKSPGTLWSSDGTAEGTAMVAPPPPGQGQIRPFAACAGVLYAFTENLDVQTLWRSDGTAAGTKVVTTFGSPGDNARTKPVTHVDPIAVGSTLFFVMTEEDAFKVKDENAKVASAGIWKTDGTKPGTVRITKRAPSFLTRMNETLYFLHRNALYRSDGSPGSAKLVKELGGSEIALATNGTSLFIGEGNRSHGWRLWKSDGTEAGTVKIDEFAGDPRTGGNAFANNQPFTVLGDIVVFPASRTQADMEPWAAR